MTLQHKCVFLYLLCKDLESGWLGNRLDLFTTVRTYLPTPLFYLHAVPPHRFPILTIPVGVYGPLSVAFICISMLTNNI